MCSGRRALFLCERDGSKNLNKWMNRKFSDGKKELAIQLDRGGCRVCCYYQVFVDKLSAAQHQPIHLSGGCTAAGRRASSKQSGRAYSECLEGTVSKESGLRPESCG